MAAGMQGADLGDMERLRGTFTRNAGEVRTLQAQINGVVHSAAWTGSAADAFRAQWDGEFSAGLRRLVEALDAQAQLVARRAEAIRIATSVAG
jgi:WXG100 family type VII secretion target